MEPVTRVIDIPATAGNVVYTKSVPAGKSWRFVHAKIILVADATVASRVVMAGFTDSAGTASRIHSAGSAAITASLTRGVQFKETSLLDTPTATFVDTVTYLSSVQFRGRGYNGDKFAIKVAAGVAGDSYSGTATFIEES